MTITIIYFLIGVCITFFSFYDKQSIPMKIIGIIIIFYNLLNLILYLFPYQIHPVINNIVIISITLLMIVIIMFTYIPNKAASITTILIILTISILTYSIFFYPFTIYKESDGHKLVGIGSRFTSIGETTIFYYKIINPIIVQRSPYMMENYGVVLGNISSVIDREPYQVEYFEENDN